MKKLLGGVFVFLIFVFSISAKENQLSIDEQAQIGKLKNGLTYYIKKNTIHEKKASLRLVVKAGSALETEEERGIAHFVEHLVFRGSDNFKDWEVIKYLESIGAQFGADTNAYTSFDRTAYILEVPLNNPEDLDKAILILSDFAFRAHMKDEIIDVERNIVLDEMRASRGANLRIAEKHLNTYLKGTSYDDRLPIGLEDVIKNSSYETIRGFYKKWYKPESMAVIVVGDIDENEVKNSIDSHFSSPASEDFIEPQYIVNEKEYNDFSIVYDPEISMCSIELLNISQSKSIKKEKDVRDSLQSSILRQIINERFFALTKEDTPPFMDAGSYSMRMLTSLNISGFGAQCFEDEPLEALRAILLEIERIKKYGITQDEFDRAKFIIENGIDQSLKNLDKIENSTLIMGFVDNFIHKDVSCSQEYIWDLEKKLLSDISFDETLKKCQSFFSEDYWIVAYTGPVDKPISKNEITQIILEASHLDIQPINHVISDKNYEAKLIAPKLILSEKNENLNTLSLAFENGLKVVLKPTDLKKDEIHISSYAANGIALLPEELIDSAEVCIGYYDESGLGGIHPVELDKFLRIKDSHLSINLDYNARNISAATKRDHLEDILMLINRIFTTKNYRVDVWKTLLAKEKEIQSEMEKNPGYIFYKKLYNTLYNDHYLFAKSNLDKANIEDAQKILDHYFTDPDGFTFYIVGDFDLDEVSSLVQKYLGGIETQEKTIELLSDLPSIGFNITNEKNFIKAGFEEKSQGIIAYNLQSSAMVNEKSWYSLHMCKTLFNQRLLDVLRKENAQSYGAGTNHVMLFNPSLDHFNFYIGFTGPVDQTSSMVDIAKDVILDFIQEGVSDSDFEAARLIIKNDLKEANIYNNTWANFLMKADMRQLDPNVMNDYEKILDDISMQDLMDFSKTLFSKEQNSSFIWLPQD